MEIGSGRITYILSDFSLATMIFCDGKVNRCRTMGFAGLSSRHGVQARDDGGVGSR